MQCLLQALNDFGAKPGQTVTEFIASSNQITFLADGGIDNVAIVEGKWPETKVEPHDIVFCSHAMYGVADFAAFVHAMEAAATQRCVMLLRAPTPNGVMAEAARRVWGQPHDSPNFHVAYNALLQMGIFADVRMEDTGLWRPWVNHTIDDAMADVKRRLALPDESEYDAFLRDLLERRLTKTDDGYEWPRGVRSALVTWEV